MWNAARAAEIAMAPTRRPAPPPADRRRLPIGAARPLPPGCVILHKPPGVPFHATDRQQGLLQLVRSQQGQPHLPYEGPLWAVHRLDSISSGCLVLATRREAAGQLVAAFRRRQVHKYYVALSDRRPSKKMGSVVADMQRGRRCVQAAAGASRAAAQHVPQPRRAAGGRALLRAVACGSIAAPRTPPPLARGSWMLARTTAKPAVTRFISAAVPGRRPGLRAFLLKPETGLTHQLRVALKSLGSPVLGDEVGCGWAGCEPLPMLRLATRRPPPLTLLPAAEPPQPVRRSTPLIAAAPPAAVCRQGSGAAGGARLPALCGAAIPAGRRVRAGGVPTRPRRRVLLARVRRRV